MSRFTLLGTILLFAEPALRVMLALVLLAGQRTRHARMVARAVGITLSALAVLLLVVVVAGASRLMAGSLIHPAVITIALGLTGAVVLLYAPAIALLLRMLGRDAWRLRLRPAPVAAGMGPAGDAVGRPAGEAAGRTASDSAGQATVREPAEGAAEAAGAAAAASAMHNAALCLVLGSAAVWIGVGLAALLV